MQRRQYIKREKQWRHLWRQMREDDSKCRRDPDLHRSVLFWKPDPDPEPYQNEKLDPDPHQTQN